MERFTILRLIEAAAARHASRPALQRQNREGLETITYRELVARVETLARWIMAQGGGAGERVALLAPNGPEWVIAALAVIRAGRILVPLDMQFTPDEVFGLTDHSQATSIVVSRQYANLAQLRDYPGLSQWPLENLIADLATLEGSGAPFPERTPDDLAFLIYTSGTSGAPKGVPMTHHNVTSNVIAVTERLEPRPTDVWLSLLPLSHGLELCMGLFAPLSCGAAICYPRSRRPDQILSAMRESGTSVMITVPAILDYFAKVIRSKAPKGWRGALVRRVLTLFPNTVRRKLVAKLSGMPVGQLRGVVCGGAFIAEELERIWASLGLPIIQGYGLTEAGPVIAVNVVGNPTRASAGEVLPICQVRIGEPNEAGVGEILVKSPSMMASYYNNEEATAAAFTADGWLKTGDLGFIDSEGEMRVSGRSKDVIITGNGLNVYPEEIEAKLEEHRFVRKACVVQKPITSRGRRAERDGDQVWAVVVLDEDELRLENPKVLENEKELTKVLWQILADTNTRLAAYKRPAGIDLWAELPITRSGKVQRQRVRQVLSEGAAAPQA